MAQIIIKGIIGTDYTYTQLLTDFAACGVEMIDLYIDSPGGDVQQGNDMADFIQSKAERFLSVSNSGDVASIAAPIFLALPYEKRLFNPAKGVALIHNPYLPPESMADMDTTADGLALISNIMRQEEAQMSKFMAKQTGTDVDVIAEFMKINEPLSVDQLKAMHFAQIVEYKAVAFFKPNQITEKMNTEDVEKIIDKKNDSLFDRIVARFFPPKAVALMVTDATGAMIEFPDVLEGGEPKEGDTAKLDTGAPVPDGDVVMADGKTFTFAGGKLTKVTDAVEEPAVNVGVEALQAKIAELEAQLAAKGQAEIALRAQIKSQMIVINPEEKKDKTPEKKSQWAELREKLN